MIQTAETSDPSSQTENRPRCPALLVSVRSAAEAREALQGGAAVIDIKEPSAGSLGAADPNVWSAVAKEVAGRVPLSAALGELQDEAVGWLAGQTGVVRYAKVGLAGCARQPRWHERWIQLLKRLPPHVEGVAVAYADAQLASAPPPEEVVARAAQSRSRVQVIATWNKTQGGLLDHINLSRLAQLCTVARRANLHIALAGSLDIPTACSLLKLDPDWIAVRTSVCRGSRTSPVDSALVVHFTRMLRTASLAGRVTLSGSM